jgi:hypothetical protein
MQPTPQLPPPAKPWRADGLRGAALATDSKAVVALVLGAFSLFCCGWLGMVLGIPAIVFGALSLRDIRRSDGILGGRALATAGIVLGGIGSLCFAGWMGFVAYSSLHSKPPPPAPPGASPLSTPASPVAGASAAPLVPPGGWGRIHVVDLHASAVALRAQLADQVKTARTAGEIVLVETTAASCEACDEIARSLRDPALQAALAGVRLVRLDASEVGGELAPIGMREPALPWFYLLDARGNARDGISADEWDDNDAESIAPVLSAFVQGKLRSRRRRWRGTML